MGGLFLVLVNGLFMGVIGKVIGEIGGSSSLSRCNRPGSDDWGSHVMAVWAESKELHLVVQDQNRIKQNSSEQHQRVYSTREWRINLSCFLSAVQVIDTACIASRAAATNTPTNRCPFLQVTSLTAYRLF